MQVITANVTKGGVGKTTTAAVLAQAAAYKEKRVLAIDLDSQGNLSFALGVRAGDATRNAYNLLTGAQEPQNTIIRSSQNIDVIPAAWNLATITGGPGSARRLQKALAPIKNNYDYVIIDTPSSGELQYNALQASTALIIPLQPDSYNVQSLYQMSDIASQFRRSNPALFFIGVIMTYYDGRSNHARTLRDTIRNEAAGMGLQYLGEVRKAIAVQEAASFKESLFNFAPKSTAAADYLKVFEALPN